MLELGPCLNSFIPQEHKAKQDVLVLCRLKPPLSCCLPATQAKMLLQPHTQGSSRLVITKQHRESSCSATEPTPTKISDETSPNLDPLATKASSDSQNQ